jgi:hypothetical protein
MVNAACARLRLHGRRRADAAQLRARHQLKRRATAIHREARALQSRPAARADAPARQRPRMREGSASHRARRRRPPHNRPPFRIAARPRARPPPQSGRAGRDEKRCVGFGNGIQMKTQRHHAGQNVVRRRDVQEAALDRPRTKARDVPALRHHDGPILMPGHGPVCSSGLVEEHRPDRPARLAKHRGSQSADRPRGRKERPERRDSLQSDAGVAGLPIGNRRCEPGQGFCVDRSTDPQRPALREDNGIVL